MSESTKKPDAQQQNATKEAMPFDPRVVLKGMEGTMKSATEMVISPPGVDAELRIRAYPGQTIGFNQFKQIVNAMESTFLFHVYDKEKLVAQAEEIEAKEKEAAANQEPEKPKQEMKVKRTNPT